MSRQPNEPRLPFVPRLPEASGDPGAADSEILISFDFDSYYDLLGVSLSTPTEKVKDATYGVVSTYQKRARQGDESSNQRLVSITTAQETLSKADKRADYDGRPDTVFFSVWDLFEEEDLSWADGLEAIRLLAIGPDGADPWRDAAPNVTREPLSRLEELLDEERRKERA